MLPPIMRRSEARLAAEYLARAEAWLDEVAPEVAASVRSVRKRLLVELDLLADSDAEAA